MEGLRYYACKVKFDGKSRFIAWYSADLDGFLRAPGGRLIVADDVGALGVPLEVAEQVTYDFDRVQAWCDASDATRLDCQAFLDAWNFLDDLTGLHAGADTPYTRLSRAAARVYDKLFWGNNLPSVTPPAERFEPSWSPEELATIRGVLKSGLAILAAELTESA